MSAFSYTEAANLLNSSLRSDTVYLALFLTDPTAAGSGVEASGGGYARKSVSFSAPSLVGGKETCYNSAPVNFGEFSAALGTISYLGLYDAITGGNLKWYGAFDRAKAIDAGDSVVLPVNALSVSLS